MQDRYPGAGGGLPRLLSPVFLSSLIQRGCLDACHVPFVLASLLGGLGGALGSIAGNSVGRTGLWVGGVAGGLLGAAAAVAIARSRGWIAAQQYRGATAGAAVGFLAAAAIAVNTLSSPIGPILGSGMTGLGALLGARLAARGSARDND